MQYQGPPANRGPLGDREGTCLRGAAGQNDDTGAPGSITELDYTLAVTHRLGFLCLLFNFNQQYQGLIPDSRAFHVISSAMDDLDRRIIQTLAGDARKPLSRVAEDLDVAQTTLHQRVRRLEDHGIIRGSRLTIDWEAAGLPVVALISIEMTERGSLQRAADQLTEIPYVVSCFAITGEFDLMLVVRAKSSEHLGEVLEDLRNQGLGRSRTVVVLNTFFEYRTPPIEE